MQFYLLSYRKISDELIESRLFKNDTLKWKALLFTLYAINEENVMDTNINLIKFEWALIGPLFLGSYLQQVFSITF